MPSRFQPNNSYKLKLQSKCSINEPEQFTGTYTLANRCKQKTTCCVGFSAVFFFFPSGYVSLNIKAVESPSFS